jgi:hypothetical protein
MLLKKLMERYNTPEDMPEATKRLVKMRVCTALKHWLDIEFDLLDANMLNKLTHFMENELEQNADAKLAKVVERLKKRVVNTTQRKKKAGKFHFLELPPAPKIPKNISHKITIHDMDELEVARQLTLCCFSYFVKIKPMELFSKNWTNTEPSNVSIMIDLFNVISSWVTTSIVKERELRNRAKLLNKHIIIAKVCFFFIFFLAKIQHYEEKKN